MTDAEKLARESLANLQDAVAAKDIDRLAGVFDDDVVLFGTASANLDRDEALSYLARVVAQEGIIRWAWDRLAILVAEPHLIAFAVVGSVGLDDVAGEPIGARDSFRLTCVLVERDQRWRIRHFHGSVPEQG